MTKGLCHAIEVVVLMDHLSETIDLPFFYGCMWRVMVSNPGLRPPALNYLLRRFPKITGAEGIGLILKKRGRGPRRKRESVRGLFLLLLFTQ